MCRRCFAGVWKSSEICVMALSMCSSINEYLGSQSMLDGVDGDKGKYYRRDQRI